MSNAAIALVRTSANTATLTVDGENIETVIHGRSLLTSHNMAKAARIAGLSIDQLDDALTYAEDELLTAI